MASTASSGTDGRGRPAVLVGIGGSHPSHALTWAVTYAEQVRLGSVGLHRAHHSTCPLVLVPSA